VLVLGEGVNEMSKQKTCLVLGAGGFIGTHLVNRLKKEGNWVRGVDLKYPEFSTTTADSFIIADLRDFRLVHEVIGYAGISRVPFQTLPKEFDQPFDEIYQLAADMGGASYIFTGEHDADIMHNSATINLTVLDTLQKYNEKFGINQTKIFYSSSACIYPNYNQLDPNNPKCSEDSAYPADPDSLYGWEKLFSERLYFAYNKNYNIPVRVARFHNIFGPLGAWNNGKEKAPAAICRQVASNQKGIDIWSDGEQTRSFLYIDDCIDAVRLLMNSDFIGPVNIGSEEMVSINTLVDLVSCIEGKSITKVYKKGPFGVRGRNSDNKLIKEKLGWEPKWRLMEGLLRTYKWIAEQIRENG
jgi:nucleoside-diphosphate-sugar epimerase